MKKNLLKYIFITMFAMCISFIGINKIYATDYCTQKTNRLYCEYKLSDNVSVIYKIDNSTLTADIKAPDDSTYYHYAITQNFSINNFYFPSEEVKYRCLSKVVVSKATSAFGGGATTEVYEISTKYQGGMSGWNQFWSGIKLVDVSLGETCSSIGKDYKPLETACGEYGGLNIISKKNEDGTFSYVGNYASDVINKNDLKLGENFSFINPVIDKETGCPDKVCFEHKGSSTVFKATTDSTLCKDKTSEATTGSDLENDQNNDSGKDAWSDIPALIDGISNIENGGINCNDDAILAVIQFAQKIFGFMKIGAVALLMLLTAIDFMGAVSSDSGDAFKKATQKFVKRAIFTVALILLPSLINLIFTIVTITNGMCVIS